MIHNTNSATSEAVDRHPVFRIEKTILITLSLLGIAVMLTVNWQLALLLWPWVNEIGWHWIPGFFAFVCLLLGPPVVLRGAISITTSRPSSKRLFWWNSTVFLTLIVIGLLAYWAFLPSGSWWRNGYWWGWAAIVITLSILASGARMFSVVQKVTTRNSRGSYAHEWRFNRGDVNAPPTLGLAMSGGGIRSAAFNLGVLRALHEAELLRFVDVMSAVSGGSYIMSWYLLQPFYANQAAARNNKSFNMDEVIDEMFTSDGRFQKYLRLNSNVITLFDTTLIALLFGTTLEQTIRATSSIGDDLDGFNQGGSTREKYRHGIQKLFHGHPRKDSVNKIDNAHSTSLADPQERSARFAFVKPVTYSELSDFAKEHNLPFFIFNGATLVERSHRHELWPTAFELTADDLGSDLCGYKRWDVLSERDTERRRLLREEYERYPRVLRWTAAPSRGLKQVSRWLDLVNLAPAISGAAIGLSSFDSNKRPWVTKLRTWLPFVANLDLGFLFPHETWNTEVPVYVSDGGHAENLGAYALIKRQCGTIIVVDAEYESTMPYKFAAYVKLCERLAEEESMSLQIPDITDYLEKKPETPPPFVAKGTVTPDMKQNPGGRVLSIIYIKLGLDKDRLHTYPHEVQEHAHADDRFPQNSTLRQKYSPEKFAAYRELGRYVCSDTVRDLRKQLNQQNISAESPISH